jgi:hypothetical protein
MKCVYSGMIEVGMACWKADGFKDFMTTDWTTGWTEFDPRQRQRIFFSLYPVCPDQLWGLPSLLSNGGPFPVGKARPGRDADHSTPSSADVRNE